jgi:hypothetical protein
MALRTLLHVCLLRIDIERTAASAVTLASMIKASIELHIHCKCLLKHAFY